MSNLGLSGTSCSLFSEKIQTSEFFVYFTMNYYWKKNQNCPNEKTVLSWTCFVLIDILIRKEWINKIFYVEQHKHNFLKVQPLENSNYDTSNICEKMFVNQNIIFGTFS